MEKIRAMRPFYILLEDLTKSALTRQTLLERDRVLALEAVMAHAPDMGIDAALKAYGDLLLPTEHKLLQTLTKVELAALKSIRAKVGNLFGDKAVSINIHEK